MNVVLLDDHKLFRIGLRELIHRSKSHRVIAEFSSGEEMLQTFDGNADLVLADISLEDQNGIAVVSQLRKKFPSLKTAMLSMHKEPHIIREAINTGIVGYFNKDVDLEELIFGLRKIEEGGRYFSSQITEVLLNSEGTAPAYSLTAREKQILQLMVDGFSSDEIASRMSLSKRTIDTHRSNLLAKFNLKNTAQLVRYIVDKKLL